MERKCPSCGTWNNDNDFCKQCGMAISPKELEKLEVVKRQTFSDKVKKTMVDKGFIRFKNSKNPFLRELYKILYGFWVVYMAIISFILWFITLLAG